MNVVSDGLVCPIIDARHNQVYTALFDNGVCIKEPYIEDIDKLLSGLDDEKVLFLGDGAIAYRDRIESNEKFAIAPSHLLMQKASSVCYGAYKRAKNDDFDQLFSLVPLYLRKSQAERELEEKEQ